MPNNYYFLISGLPDISFDSTKYSITACQFFSDIEEQVSSLDAHYLRSTRFSYDNENLIALLDKRNNKFDTRGNFSSEELDSGIKNPEQLPEYMKLFLDSYHSGKALFHGLTIVDQLAWVFYDEMLNQKNKFLCEWFTFDRDLRNCIAAINFRNSQNGTFSGVKSLIDSVLVGRNEITDSIIRSKQVDFGLGTMVPWIDELIAASASQLVEYEKFIDRLRWSKLDELTVISGFTIDTILAFVIKLFMVERWRSLDAKTGKEQFKHLTGELEADMNRFLR